MKTIVEGKIFIFGNNLDTDQIFPGRYLALTRAEDIKRHAMEGADPNFIQTFTAGDIIVAGANFGCGSSREQAVFALKEVGTGAIIAESFARIFYRNAINLGLPLLVCPPLRDQVSAGDVISINLQTGEIQSTTTEGHWQAQPLSGYVLKILEAGGISPLVKTQLKRQPFP